MEYVFFIAYEVYTRGFDGKGSVLVTTNSKAGDAISETVSVTKQKLVEDGKASSLNGIVITSVSLVGEQEEQVSEGYKHLKKMFCALYSDARAGLSDEVIYKRYHLLFSLIDSEKG